MTLPKVLRVALIKTDSKINQRVITQSHSQDICPQVETVLLGLPTGISAADCRDIWHQLIEKPFNLILDSRDPDPGNIDLLEVFGDEPLISNLADPGNPGIIAAIGKNLFHR